MEEQPDMKLKNDLTNKTRKNTKKYNTTRKIRVKTARERFRERLSLPIGTSSVGIIPTKEMNEQFEIANKYRDIYHKAHPEIYSKNIL